MKIPEEFGTKNVQFKVVGINNAGELYPCSGGNKDFRFSSPVKKNGVWIAGEWTPPEKDVVVCARGYHVTTEPCEWVRSHPARIYFAETTGLFNESTMNNSDKTAFESIRLLRPVQLKDIHPDDREYDDIEFISNIMPQSVCAKVLTHIVLGHLAAHPEYYPDLPPEITELLEKYAYGRVRDEDKVAALHYHDMCVVGFPLSDLMRLPHQLFDGHVRSLTRTTWGALNNIFEKTLPGEFFQDLVSVELRNDYGDNWNYNEPIYFDSKRKKFYPVKRRQTDRNTLGVLYGDMSLAVKVVVETEEGQLIPCSGGNVHFQYSPPRKSRNGTYHPGDWAPVESPSVCYRGYHVTHQPQAWAAISGDVYALYSGVKLRMFMAQTRGARSGSGGQKTAFESIRLLRPLQPRDMAVLGYEVCESSLVLPQILPNKKLLRAIFAVAALNELADMDPANALSQVNEYKLEGLVAQERHDEVVELLHKAANAGELQPSDKTRALIISSEYDSYTLYDAPHYLGDGTTAFIFRCWNACDPNRVAQLIADLLHKSFYTNHNQPWRVAKVKGRYVIRPVKA